MHNCSCSFLLGRFRQTCQHVLCQAELTSLTDCACTMHARCSGIILLAVQVREVGDGNINYVYIVEGPSGGVVLKQGLPYIRIAHDWPLTQVGLVFSAVIHHDVKNDLASCSAAGFCHVHLLCKRLCCHKLQPELWQCILFFSRSLRSGDENPGRWQDQAIALCI